MPYIGNRRIFNVIGKGEKGDKGDPGNPEASVVQTTGQDTQAVMSQKATTEAINDTIVQTTGNSESVVMSQKAVTERLLERMPRINVLTCYNYISIDTTNGTLSIPANTELMLGSSIKVLSEDIIIPLKAVNSTSGSWVLYNKTSGSFTAYGYYELAGLDSSNYYYLCSIRRDIVGYQYKASCDLLVPHYINDTLIGSIENVVPIDSVNLLDMRTTEKGHINRNTGIIEVYKDDPDESRTSTYIAVEAGKKYTLRVISPEIPPNGVWFGIHEYDANKTYIKREESSSNTVSYGEYAVTTRHYTVPYNVAFVRISARLYKNGFMDFHRGTGNFPISSYAIGANLISSESGEADNETDNTSLTDVSNALVGSASGEIVSISDVSPLAHKIAVKVTGLADDTEVVVKSYGKNLFDNKQSKYSGLAGMTATDDQITVSITGGTWVSANFALPRVIVGKKITISANVVTSGINKACMRLMWMKGSSADQKMPSLLTQYISTQELQKISLSCDVPEQITEGYGTLCLMLYANVNATLESGVTYTATYSNIQVEVNDTDTDYESFVEGETITITPTEGGELTSISPSMTICTETVGAILNVDYNKDINRAFADNEATKAGYPAYWNEAVEIAEKKIEQFQNEGGVNTFTCGFITDTHVSGATNGAFAKIMKQVMDTCDIPMLLHGGDIVSGAGIISKENLIAEIAHHKEIFKDIEDRCLLTIGNHDPAFGVNSYYDSNLTTGEIYNYIFRKDQKKHGMVFGDTGRYFYKDIPAQKVRYIVLDSQDYDTVLNENQIVVANNKMGAFKFGGTQLAWFADVALNVPEGYSVIACSHLAPYNSNAINNAGWTGEDVARDSEVVLGILNAFKNKTTYEYSGTIGSDTLAENYSVSVDFSDYHGDFVCWLGGHVHKDNIFTVNGLIFVTTANCSASQATNPAEFAPVKTTGTPTEYIMDFLCVNKATRTCNIVRLGAELERNAEGRSFTY